MFGRQLQIKYFNKKKLVETMKREPKEVIMNEEGDIFNDAPHHSFHEDADGPLDQVEVGFEDEGDKLDFLTNNQADPARVQNIKDMFRVQNEKRFQAAGGAERIQLDAFRI